MKQMTDEEIRESDGLQGTFSRAEDKYLNAHCDEFLAYIDGRRPTYERFSKWIKSLDVPELSEETIKARWEKIKADAKLPLPKEEDLDFKSFAEESILDCLYECPESFIEWLVKQSQGVALIKQWAETDEYMNNNALRIQWEELKDGVPLSIRLIDAYDDDDNNALAP